MIVGDWLIAWRAGLRARILQPRTSLLSVISIALGVAVFLSITIANRGAVESFTNAFSQITGKAELEIRGDLPDSILPSVQACKGVLAATPIIEAMVTLPDFPGESLHLAGIDPFTAEGVLGMEPNLEGGSGEGLAAWLGKEMVVAVGADFLTSHHLHLGDSVSLQGPGGPKKVKIGFEITHHAGFAEGHVAAIDIAAAQEWIGKIGKLSAILIKLRNPTEKEAVIARLREIVPSTASIEPPSQRTKQVEIMLASFRMNLSALSLVSLMVGMFFVGNTAAAAVIHNRISLGIMRAVGVGRRMILSMVLAEAALCGVVGSLLGIIISPLLAGILAAPVAQTVTALYLPVQSQGGWPSLLEGLAATLAGVGVSLLAAWIPARAASRVDPTLVLHPGSAPEIFPMPVGSLALLGILLLGLATLFSVGALHGGLALLGFGAAFLVLAGFSLLVPGAIMLVARLMGKASLFSGPIVRLALEQSLRSLHRTAPTVAALAAAVSMMVGISVMIHSFRGSVIAWTNRTLTADLFIAPASNELLGLAHTLPAGVQEWWQKQPEVKEVGTFREFEIRSVTGESVMLGVVSGSARGTIDFLHGGGEEKTRDLLSGKGVALSESLAQRLQLKQGEMIVLATPKGTLSPPILDLYRDYTRDRGVALMGAALFRQLWGDQGIHSLAIGFLHGATQQQIDQKSQEFVKAFGGKEAFVCYSNRTLKERIVEIFNQTFAITAVLRSISIVVAIGGVMLTLGMLVMERSREIGVLRAMGASSVQIVQMMIAEAGFIGIVASAVGLVSGAGLACVLTWVINRAFFGWSIDLSYPWWELAMVPLWMTCAAVVAGMIPAWRAAAIPPATALRME
jgi:putative ABC transport system permease protein